MFGGGGRLVYLLIMFAIVIYGLVDIKLVCRIPVIIVILGGCLYCRCDRLEQSKCLHYMSTISYQFYLSQFSLWKILLYIMPEFCIENNIARIIFSLICCLGMSVLMYECIDKKIQKKFKNVIQ